MDSGVCVLMTGSQELYITSKASELKGFFVLLIGDGCICDV